MTLSSTIKNNLDEFLDDKSKGKRRQELLKYFNTFSDVPKKKIWKIYTDLNVGDKEKFWENMKDIKDSSEKKDFLNSMNLLSRKEKIELLKNTPDQYKNNVIVILIDSKEKVPEKSKWYDKRITYGIAFFMLILNLIIVSWWDALSEENAARTIVLVGLVTFFGVLTLSAHHNHTKNDDAQEKHATGTMRRAIAASIVLVYLISFSAITFGEFGDKELGLTTTASNEIITQINQTFNEILESEDGANSEEMKNALTEEVKGKLSDLRSELTTKLKSKETILGHFTTVVTAVIGFYFGSKAVESLVKKNGEKNNKNGKTAETPEKKNETDLTKKLGEYGEKLDKIMKHLKI